jgi:tetratricopeptide (TPR) repeat protein
MRHRSIGREHALHFQSMRASLTALVLAAVVLVGSREHARAEPSESATLLIAQGLQKESDGDELGAMKRYRDAIEIDPTAEPAYLALGALRTKRNELSEAENIYDVALGRLPGSRALYLARGRVHRLRGHVSEARLDLRRAWTLEGNSGSNDELSIMREVIALDHEQHDPAGELLAWRRILAIAHARGDAKLKTEASVQARALGIFVGEADPVLSGKTLPEPMRRSLASVARRGG